MKILLAFVAAVGLSCGKVASESPPDSGTTTCVLDTDTFDNGCTLSP